MSKEYFNEDGTPFSQAQLELMRQTEEYAAKKMKEGVSKEELDAVTVTREEFIAEFFPGYYVIHK